MQHAALNQLVAFYQRLDASQLSMLAEIYHPDIRLIDPVAEHQGIVVVERYFSALLKNLRHCRFEMTLIRELGDDALLLWRMEYAHPRLQGGADQTLQGSSYLKMRDGKVIFQRDYYDMGAMLYEKLPLLGPVVRLIKRRLRP